MLPTAKTFSRTKPKENQGANVANVEVLNNLFLVTRVHVCWNLKTVQERHGAIRLDFAPAGVFSL